ncbi:restriction endonuclease AlwI [Streptococcus agalactiae LMG 14747]|uniref:Restriction endonuclease AlwI n=1 Tax=Streptococcus agalactiae LMG 14747 TaxID=1154860 RepID=V6Z5X9_STRAG|nr:AlwI family type II restriction endonuclease [Streptococcus hyovaginalis]ESV55019.1 restriction endonuclease AlwI [Streptococcus agalactiae LMG 14747]
MKLKNTAETFNLGDTSFRRKTLIDDYKILLPFLQQTNLEYPEWNNDAQVEFYEKIMTKTDLFSRNDEEDFAKRGRTLTNALVKIGLTNEKRKLSKIAIDWLNGNTLNADDIEKSLGIDLTNLLFTRQLLKLRIYDSNGVNYFYPFRVALEIVKRYQNIPQQDFLTLVHLIKPTFDNATIAAIVKDYGRVASNQEIFSEFLDKAFPESHTDITASEFFGKKVLDRTVFDTLFVNRKSSVAQDVYFEFVLKLLSFKSEKTQEKLNELMKISLDDKIKKAFGFGKSVFIKAKNVQEFLELNFDNILLWEDNSQIYNQFVLSKKDDIVREYRDMTKRTFNLSGLFDFSNGLVNATNKNIFSIIFADMPFSGEERYSLYEQDLSYSFYQEVSISEILNLDRNQVLSSIKENLGVTDSSQIESVVATQKEYKFRQFISSEFPREKVIALLPLFSTRTDNEIKAQVSEAATVPTIYEYIVAIAWFYISSEEFFITKSLNLTLDGNMRPLSHAAGGTGDIVIHYKNLTLMLEVTLMNSQAQKRGEWEPVLRHATNLTVDEYPKNVITLFVADELDDNTVNIWRAVASVPLRSSNKNESADLVKIFPLENKELLDMLQNNSTEKRLFTAIDKSYAELSGNFDLSWRADILDEI